MGLFSFIGGLLGGTKTSKGSTSTTTTSDPYAPVVPYLTSYLDKVNGIYDNTPQFSALEQQGYNTLNGVASDQSSLNGAIAANDATVSGQYLTPDTNPYLADIARRVSGIAGANVNATFGGKGRSSGGLAGYYAGKGVTDSLTDLYGQQYDNERARQQQAIAQSVGLDQQRYAAPQALISAGQNISARPFDIAQQQGGILAQIARLGGTTTSNGTTSGSATSPQDGIIGKIANSFTNKLFPGG
jgi:hypothetical protein